jgi:hypothetical protein
VCSVALSRPPSLVPSSPANYRVPAYKLFSSPSTTSHHHHHPHVLHSQHTENVAARPVNSTGFTSPTACSTAFHRRKLRPAKSSSYPTGPHQAPNHHQVVDNCGICIRAKATLSDSTRRLSCNHCAVRGNRAVNTTVPTASLSFYLGHLTHNLFFK